MERNKCCICYGKLKVICKINNIPYTSIPTIKYCSNKDILSFVQCQKCLTFQLKNLVKLTKLYSINHNIPIVGKLWTQHYQELSQFIKNNTPIKDKLILEFADPSAKIARLITGFKKWYIIEPNYSEEFVSQLNKTVDNKIVFIRDWFGQNLELEKYNIEEGSIDMIVHSHFFEHLYEPNNFLSRVYHILKDNGDMIFSIPDMEYLATNQLWPFLGISFEHTFYIDTVIVEYLLNMNGFIILNIYKYQNHSIFIHCQKTKKSLKMLENNMLDKLITSHSNSIDLFYASLNNYKDLVNELNTKIQMYHESNIFLFGCHYQSQVLLGLGLNQKRILGLLDNNSDKIGKYLFGFKLKTYSPNILSDSKIKGPNVVIIYQGIYTTEIKKQIINIDPKCIFI